MVRETGLVDMKKPGGISRRCQGFHPIESFPNADPCRHGSMTEVKWTAWSVIFFAVPVFPIQKKCQLDYKRKIMELKHAIKGKRKGNIWNHHKGFCLHNGSFVYLVGVQNYDVLLAICSSKTWSGWEHFWRKMLIIHLYLKLQRDMDQSFF